MCHPLTSSGDGKWPLRPVGLQVPAAGPPFLISPRFRPGPAPAAGERLSNEHARRNYLTCPCARWCGRAVSSSWKLPPRGARRTGRGEGCAPSRPPPSRGRARRPRPPPLSRGEGRAAGGGDGAEAGVGGASRPTPPPERVPAAAPCRSPRPRRRRRGAPLPWEPGPGRSRTGRFPVRRTCSHFREAGWKQLGPRQPELATCHLAWRPLSDF